jgi:phage repressor protein C with HTH and peptisase S24 domain
MIRVRVISKHFAVCCGTGIDWGADDGVDYEKSIWIDNSQLAMKYTNDELISVHADGDSMEPYISDNDLVIFSPNEQEITSPGILMVVNYNGKMIVRGLIVNGQKQVIMKPHNKRYDDITVTDNDIFRICGRVVEIHATKKPTPVL